jgi:ATP-dependent Clp protease protease subunit
MLKTALVALGLVLGSFVVTAEYISYNTEPATKIEINEAVTDLELTNSEELQGSSDGLKLMPAKKTIVLQDKNTVIIRGPITAKSVAQIQNDAFNKAAKLGKTQPLYLVLDTPGGSVFSGMELIDNLRALPNDIRTITLFSASMGFQIVQNMGKRYITPSGTLMSHRASLGGLKGQLDGEFETRYQMIKRKVDYLDAIASKRMNMSVKNYKSLILNEYWVHGFDAAKENAADEMINVRCGKTLNGTVNEKVMTFFGPVNVTFSKCPLITGPLAVNFKRIKSEHKTKVKRAINAAFRNKREYVQDFILTEDHYKFFE